MGKLSKVSKHKRSKISETKAIEENCGAPCGVVENGICEDCLIQIEVEQVRERPD